jgi:hypothetical protein
MTRGALTLCLIKSLTPLAVSWQCDLELASQRAHVACHLPDFSINHLPGGGHFTTTNTLFDNGKEGWIVTSAAKNGTGQGWTCATRPAHAVTAGALPFE